MARLINLKLLADFFNKIDPKRRFTAMQRYVCSWRQSGLARPTHSLAIHAAANSRVAISLLCFCLSTDTDFQPGPDA